MADLRGKRFGVIGAGALGGAVIDRLLSAGVASADAIVACETREERRQEIAARYRVRVAADAAAADADVILLAVPPTAMVAVLDALRGALNDRRLVVSFAGAVPLDWIEARVPAGVPVVRANPNSPSIVGAGFTPVAYGRHATGAARAVADALLAVLGRSPEVPDGQMNAYTALTAVGPTYFLPVFEALIAAGGAAGLSRAAAVEAAVAVARGTADLVARRYDEPGGLKLLTGLRPLDDAAVRRLVEEAIAAALARMDDVQQKVVAGG